MTTAIDPSVPPSGVGCAECDASGGWWVHLRRCAACGHIGCCDDSLARHATARWRTTGPNCSLTRRLDVAEPPITVEWMKTMAGIDVPPELPTVYHDVEWGTPTHDEVALFRGFKPSAVTSMAPHDVDRLTADSTIGRNRRKIEATVHNARVMATCSLAQLVWEHLPRRHQRRRSWTDGRMKSPFMQTFGIENGHFEGRFRA